jgi:glucan phosphoethanolaminetransferase (alkaline phosphatase superfamily)
VTVRAHEPHRPPRGGVPGRDAWLALSLATLVTAYDLWMIGAPVSAYLTGGSVEPTTFVLVRRCLGIAAILGAHAAFVWASLASPVPVRLAALTLAGVVSLIQYGFVAGAGGVLNTQDIPMAFQILKYWPSMIRTFADWRALPPVAAFAVALAWHRGTAPRWPRRWALAAVAALAVHGAYGAAYVKRDLEFGDMSLPAPPMSAFEALQRTLVIVACDAGSEALRPYARESLAFEASGRPTGHLILVVDESISAAHLSLNGYARMTTPWLAALRDQGRIASWPEAAAAATYSNASNSSLLTGFNHFPDVDHQVERLPTIFQYARAMHYRTHLFDGQLTVRRFGLSRRDMQFIDDWRTASEFGDDPDTDMRMAAAASRVLESTDPQFVVILKRGNHEPPEGNYPRGAGPWSPSRDGVVPAGQERAAIVNSYDNAIRYNVDAFFRALLRPDGTLPRTAGIYTSDHAEMLAEHRGTPFARRLVREVAAVPLIVFGDDRPRVDTGYRASHHNIFPTLLDLMRVPAAERRWTYSRSLVGATASDRDPRPVLSGYMFGSQYAYELRDFDALTPE